MLMPAVLYLALRKAVLDAQSHQEVYAIADTVYAATSDRIEQLATAFMLCSRYLKTLVWPDPLVSDLGFPEVRPIGFNDWRAMAGALVMIALLAWSLIGSHQRSLRSYGLLFFLITFSLFSNLFLIIGTSYGERLLYAPTLGFTLLLAWAIGRAVRVDDLRSILRPNGRGAAFWGLVAVFLLPYTYLTIDRNTAWHDSGTLFARDLPNAPNSAKLTYHHGCTVLQDAVDQRTFSVKDTALVRKAIATQTRAIELHPSYGDAYLARGMAHMRLNEMAASEQDFIEALKRNPNLVLAWSNLGVVQFRADRKEDAERSFLEAVRLDPRYTDARHNLATVLANQSRLEEAVAQWKEGLRYAPDNGTMMFSLGQAYLYLGNDRLSQQWLERARARGVTDWQ
jgi:tetratricopeptide (TPR) repeat protein